ncbi:hypothetical protein LMG28727_03504 [Paraburkholderia kirstenboschensis]|nr:hypothetical protein LMG28727_03504 [Paraburkholderia kirstenboschensis]
MCFHTGWVHCGRSTQSGHSDGFRSLTAGQSAWLPFRLRAMKDAATRHFHAMKRNAEG